MAATAAPAHAMDAPAATGDEAREDADMMEKMRQYFKDSPKVNCKPKEDAWAQVNGYTFVAKAGERVSVPQDIFDLWDARGIV